jgi:hypothetical protein
MPINTKRRKRMDDHEIRAKSLEIAALMIGKYQYTPSLEKGDLYMELPKYNQLGKYEFLASLIERDILNGFPVQEEMKYVIESKGSQIDNDGLTALRKRLEP